MKKWLVLILLLITAAGTFIPCCQIDDCAADRISSNNAHDDKQEGNCSPFFACATCAGFVEIAKPVQLTVPGVERIIHHLAVVSFNLPTHSSSFWQPPRFC